jgi:hypothetical protein
VKAARYDDRVGHDDGFSMDSQDALAALGQITDGVRAAVLPTDMLPVRDGLLKSISQILARVDFEMLHAKTATLEGVDEVALTRLTA